MKTTAQAAAEYRLRRAAKIARLQDGHNAILAELVGNDKPLAVKLRAISEGALS